MKFQILGPIENLAEGQPELFKTLKLNSDDIILDINSPGGMVMEGLDLVNAIKGCSKTVTAKVNVMAASIAAYIALACDKVEMTHRDILMLHSCSTTAAGNKQELKETIAQMEAVDKVLFGIAAEHCKNAVDFAAMQQKMDRGQDVWLTGEEAANLFDNVFLMNEGKPTDLAASCDLAGLVLKAQKAEEIEKQDNSPEEKLEEPGDEEREDSEEQESQETEEDKEPEGNKEESEPYAISDSLKNLLAFADKLG